MKISNKHLLLIEPDYILGNTYQNYLRAHSFSVDVCNSIQDGVILLDKKLPELILLELQLCAHNGYEFLYEMRSYPEWGNIPVIIHTMIPSQVTKMDDSVSKNLGIVDYLYKPTTSLSKLLFTIQKHIVFTPV